MAVDTSQVNIKQEQRNALFADWIAKVEKDLEKLSKQDVMVELFSFSNPTYVGPLQALVGIPALGENKFYCTLYHYDAWQGKDVAKIIYEKLVSYNQASG